MLRGSWNDGKFSKANEFPRLESFTSVGRYFGNVYIIRTFARPGSACEQFSPRSNCFDFYAVFAFMESRPCRCQLRNHAPLFQCRIKDLSMGNPVTRFKYSEIGLLMEKLQNLKQNGLNKPRWLKSFIPRLYPYIDGRTYYSNCWKWQRAPYHMRITI